jgi:glyoxylase-like metal-dependent hydrolase (beta-lactamase superfamily II)
MKVHHLNCATMCPLGRRLINGDGGLLAAGWMVCHCLLVETAGGLVLVDGGLGLEDVREPRRRLSGWFLALVRPRLDLEETALRQVQRLGFKAEDVRHIVPTHLDLDHVGALSDFPKARVHVLEAEYGAAMARATLKERNRYRPQQWAHGPLWARHRIEGESWFGFEAVRQAQGLPPEILIVPLPGHTRGHAAIAVQVRDRWLLHAGDAYFFHGEMDPQRPWCTPGLKLFQRVVQMDGPARLRNAERLRRLAAERSGEVQVFCAHDPVELDRLAKANPEPPSAV